MKAVLVPLVCAVYFLTKYYEQKSRIIGNFQNSGWQFKEVIDVENFVADCMDMFVMIYLVAAYPSNNFRM